MQIIRDLCERFKAFFTRKTTISLITDDSKIVDENTDDLEFHVPPTPKDLDAESPLPLPLPLPLPIKDSQTLSLQAQKPTALGLLAQQRLACMATDTNTQHSGENTPEDKLDVEALEPKA